MLKTSSSTNLTSMIAMLANYVSRIHTFLLPLVFQSKTCPSNKSTELEITDVHSIYEFKCLKEALQKCTEVEQVVVKFIEEEKGLVAGILGLIKQIQYFAQASKWKKQNQTNEKILNYKFSELKESINKLPSAKFQPYHQKISNKKKQIDFIVEKSIKLQNQNIELKQKLGKCQYANTLLEEKIRKLNRQSKISEITACDDSSKRLIDRISGHIFSQQFMMKAHFQVRHQIQNLRKDNQRLKAELRRSKQVNMKIKQKYAIGQTNPINLIGQKRFNNFKSVSPDWSQSINKLEREIISLRKQRIKEEKVINNIQDKLVDIEMLGQSKINHKARWSQLRDSRDEDQTLNMFLNRNEVKHVNYAEKKSYRSDQNINLIKANRRIATEYEPSLPYCKSSQTLKESATCTMNNQAQKQQWIQNEQLKTSGYFKQPQDNLIDSHKTNKGNTKQHYRRVTEQECKTSSTLA